MNIHVQFLNKISKCYVCIVFANVHNKYKHLIDLSWFMLLNRLVPHVEQELLTLQFVLLDL